MSVRVPKHVGISLNVFVCSTHACTEVCMGICIQNVQQASLFDSRPRLVTCLYACMHDKKMYILYVAYRCYSNKNIFHDIRISIKFTITTGQTVSWITGHAISQITGQLFFQPFPRRLSIVKNFKHINHTSLCMFLYKHAYMYVRLHVYTHIYTWTYRNMIRYLFLGSFLLFIVSKFHALFSSIVIVDPEMMCMLCMYLCTHTC